MEQAAESFERVGGETEAEYVARLHASIDGDDSLSDAEKASSHETVEAWAQPQRWLDIMAEEIAASRPPGSRHIASIEGVATYRGFSAIRNDFIESLGEERGEKAYQHFRKLLDRAAAPTEDND